MKLAIEKTGERLEIKAPATVADLLDSLKIVAEDVIIVKNNEVVLLDEPLVDTDSLELLSVVSGG